MSQVSLFLLQFYSTTVEEKKLREPAPRLCRVSCLDSMETTLEWVSFTTVITFVYLYHHFPCTVI